MWPVIAVNFKCVVNTSPKSKKDTRKKEKRKRCSKSTSICTDVLLYELLSPLTYYQLTHAKIKDQWWTQAVWGKWKINIIVIITALYILCHGVAAQALFWSARNRSGFVKYLCCKNWPLTNCLCLVLCQNVSLDLK